MPSWDQSSRLRCPAHPLPNPGSSDWNAFPSWRIGGDPSRLAGNLSAGGRGDQMPCGYPYCNALLGKEPSPTIYLKGNTNLRCNCG